MENLASEDTDMDTVAFTRRTPADNIDMQNLESEDTGKDTASSTRSTSVDNVDMSKKDD